jgi:hypothetical protein
MQSRVTTSVHSSGSFVTGSFAQRINFSSEHSSADASASDSDLQANPPTALTRHYTSLQDHADQLTGASTTNQDDGLTPRNASRREGFSWGLRPGLEDQRRPSRNPMNAELERPPSPPPLHEIIRKTTIEDADHLHNSRLRHADSMESQPSVTMRLTASFSSDTSDSYTRNDRRTSIAAFARGIARHAHDFNFNTPERRRTGDSKYSDDRRDSQDRAPAKLPKKDRVLSFAPLPPMKSTEPYDNFLKPAVVVEEPSTPVDKTDKPASPVPPAKGSLRDRRKVKLDLSMPTEMPDLPARGRSPGGRSPVDIMASLGVSAPRTRSPKTPWIRNEEPKWAPGPIMQKSTPIMEEDYIQDNILAQSNNNHGGIGLLPGNDVIYSSSPKFERPPQKVRDRCYVSRPSLKRNRSGRSGHSGTSSSTLAVTPDGSWTPAENIVVQERQVATKAELQQLSQNTNSTRSRRWLWKGKASSEDTPTTPGPEQTPSRRFSINPFRRSNRISDQTDPVTPNNKSAPTTSSTRPGLRGKPSHHSTSLAHIHVPPTFIPPGVSRVPTPPIFDVQGEVKGKLADFFFDVQGGVGATTRRNKPKSSPGGYWDSDALLMSLTSDIDDRDEEEEEEGPGGPRTGGSDGFEMNGTPGLPGPGAGAGAGGWMSTGADGYLGVKPPASPSLVATSPMLGHDGWFRIAHDPNLTPDDRTLNALARQEEEERRKFEWLVPEHLPNSPLCPLHPKYKGPSKNLCYWHGRRSGHKIRKGEYGTGGKMGSSEGGSGQSWGDGRGIGAVGPRTPTKEVKKRRLVSLSSP